MLNITMKPSDTKFKILEAVVEHYTKANFGPTVDEIRETVGLGTRSSVQFHINDLVEQGFLSHLEGKARTLHATETGEQLVQLMRKHVASS